MFIIAVCLFGGCILPAFAAAPTTEAIAEVIEDSPTGLEGILSQPTEVIQALLQIFGGAAFFIALTGSQSGNKWIRIILRILNFLAMNWGKAKNRDE